MAHRERDEKLENVEIDASGNKLFKKIENFFYHYKWHVIVIGFFAIVIISGVFQMLGKTEPDAIVSYGGPYAMNSEEKADIQKALSAALGKDLNGDGKKIVTVNQYQVCTEEELAKLSSTMLTGGEVAENKKQFYNSVNLGVSAVVFVGDELYTELVANGRIEKIENIFSANQPPLENDGYSYRLGDLAIYRENEALQILSADTRVCLMIKYIHTSEKEYNVMKNAFIDIVE